MQSNTHNNLMVFLKNSFFYFVILVILNLPSYLFAQFPQGYEKGFESISSQEIFDHLKFLASDSLKGRLVGTEENKVAGEYIAKQFKSYGLKPFTIDTRRRPSYLDTIPETPRTERTIQRQEDVSNYFQKFVIKKSKLSDNNQLSLINEFKGGSYSINYQYKNDFAIQFSGPAKNLSFDTKIVFAGYGIEKGENGYNDYLDEDGDEIEVKNKVVLIVDGFPQENDSSSAFSRARNAYYRNPLRKAEVAADKGALAVLVVSSPLKFDPPFNILHERLIKSASREFEYLPQQQSSSIPIIFISTWVMNDIFQGSGKKLDSLLKLIDVTLEPQAFEIKNKKLHCEINFETKIINTQNIVGWIEGTDNNFKNECIVIGAHFDHVGFGEHGSEPKYLGQIHNGADDNASGTSGLLELAEAFSKNPPKRSLIFIAFNAEESGLIGSRYYTYYQPLKELKNTVAMLNFDMIGRNEPELLWIGGAFNGEDLVKVVEKANEQIGFELLYNVGLLSGASDQAPFLRREIPAVFFFTGLHDDYHTPLDDYDKVDTKKIERVAKLGYLTGWILANQDSRPKYKELSLEQRMKLIEESRKRLEKYRPPKEKK